jgi:hypothetical protein
VHGYTEFDAKVRTVISRRNVNLAILTVSLPLGLGEPAFYFMAAWQGVSFLFHLVRVVMVWNTRERPLQVAQSFSPSASEASNL